MDAIGLFGSLGNRQNRRGRFSLSTVQPCHTGLRGHVTCSCL